MCLSFPPFGSRSYFCLRDERRAKKVFFGAPYSSTDLKISGVGRPHANLIYSISGGKRTPYPSPMGRRPRLSVIHRVTRNFCILHFSDVLRDLRHGHCLLRLLRAHQTGVPLQRGQRPPILAQLLQARPGTRADDGCCWEHRIPLRQSSRDR